MGNMQGPWLAIAACVSMLLVPLTGCVVDVGREDLGPKWERPSTGGMEDSRWGKAPPNPLPADTQPLTFPDHGMGREASTSQAESLRLAAPDGGIL